ncbi:hypothetical protein Ahy_B04g072421 isoform A [Arachis hypogaea]|uniref:Uncharacterized protein n=1 Tax=Arachis hypogaea TaxID=3818 RepID=A0A444ZN13_ARAHY|nr:hypothetical protein Ahy_B04g072421 isoform A [Arachis hypogaea]
MLKHFFTIRCDAIVMTILACSPINSNYDRTGSPIFSHFYHSRVSVSFYLGNSNLGKQVLDLFQPNFKILISCALPLLLTSQTLHNPRNHSSLIWPVFVVVEENCSSVSLFFQLPEPAGYAWEFNLTEKKR